MQHDNSLNQDQKTLLAYLKQAYLKQILLTEEYCRSTIGIQDPASTALELSRIGYRIVFGDGKIFLEKDTPTCRVGDEK